MRNYVERFEFEEVIGQAVRLIEMVYADPDNAGHWEKLKAWADDHKNYVASSYDAPEEKGYDISKIDAPEEPKGYILTEFVDESKLNF